MNNLVAFLSHKAYRLRDASIMQAGIAGSGHPTTCLSAADIVAVLFFYVMRFDPDKYQNPNNDRFILSKGHASALLYAVWQQLGKLTLEDLCTYRQFDSVLEGHPTFRFAYTEAATGSLGIGLSIGVGEALCAKMDHKTYRVFVLLGDAETAEGSIWEAAELASYYKLNNLIAIIDCNRLGQSDVTIDAHRYDRYAKKFEAFGWQTFIIDGHSISDLIVSFDKALLEKEKPVVIIARTIKGYGISCAQDKLGFHGKAFVGEEMNRVRAELKNNFKDAVKDLSGYEWKPLLPIYVEENTVHKKNIKQVDVPLYSVGSTISTRKAYGEALRLLGAVAESIVVLDADVKNSTYAEFFADTFPNRFVQCFIAEQNMVSMGVGLNRRGKIPFISTFACFFSRAHDQIRMAAIGQAALRLAGSHAGISIGQDGPSQMGLEDISLMRCLPNSIVLYPSDGISTFKLVQLMVGYHDGISYLRTTRSDTPILYDAHEDFFIGGCKIVKKSNKDTVCIVAAGITLFEALKAYDVLCQEYGIYVRIIDLYSVKPFDEKTVIESAYEAGNRIVVVEDHYIQGGIGEMISARCNSAGVSVISLAVSLLPRSGKPEELRSWEGIDARAIVQTVVKIHK